MSVKQLKIVAWTISTSVAAIAFIAWASQMNWKFNSLSTYSLFPLLGLLAFSLMWSHYIVSVIRRKLGFKKESLQNYVEITSLIVLLLILLHPGLLIWQLWRDGFGLPPGSYLENYVAPGLKWVVVLGTLSLVAFLAYELRRWFSEKSWWRYVSYVGDVAMLGIFYHGLRLGSTLQSGWYNTVWMLYGITLVGALIYIHVFDRDL